MTIELDGRKMTDHAATHAHIKAQLNFPDWYGRNLDALHDLLTERGTETVIRLHHRSEMEQQLGPYAGVLMEVLRTAAKKNPNLKFVWE